jgi:TolB-like protein/DNA-binding winged helix-turn-helix (wHTH) protein
LETTIKFDRKEKPWENEMSRKAPEIEAKSAEEIRFGSFVFSTRTGELRLGSSGDAIPLRSQSAEVLTVLAESVGQIVSKTTLIKRVWPDTFVTDDSIVQCIADIRRALGDDGQNIVQTFPKKGYRLNATQIDERKVFAKQPYGVFFGGALAAALLVFAAYLAWEQFSPRSTAIRSDIATIAVLPFDDFSTGDDAGYLSDAIAEGIITELARSKTYAVIARNSSFRYRGEQVGVRKIGQELGVNYVLEGSQQKSGDELRVTAQLIDAVNGRHLWSNSYERKISDLFLVQDQIIRTLADRVGYRIQRPLPVADENRVTALHLYLQGIDEFRKHHSAESAEFLRQSSLKAIEIDPDSEFGYIGLAAAYRQNAVYGWNGYDRGEALVLAEENAEKAIELGPNDADSHYVRARVYEERGAFNQAIQRYDRAIELNPSASNIMAASSSSLLYVGRVDDAIARINRAMGIDPFYPDWYDWQMAWALWEKRDCEGAVAAMHRMAKIYDAAQRMLAVSYACLGDKQKAHEALAIFLETSSQSTLRSEREKLQNMWNEESLDRWLEDLRFAGMPE